jgi:hypothetical protein
MFNQKLYTIFLLMDIIGGLIQKGGGLFEGRGLNRVCYISTHPPWLKTVNLSDRNLCYWNFAKVEVFY